MPTKAAEYLDEKTLDRLNADKPSNRDLADGTEYSVKFQRPNIMEEVAKANAKLPKPPMLRGIPAALAKARETRYAQKTNGVATVSVEVNATKGNRPKE